MENFIFVQGIIRVTEVALIQVFFRTVGFKHTQHAKKVKMKTRNTMAPSYYSKASSTQKWEFNCFLVWFMEFSFIFSCLGKAKVFPLNLTRQSKSTFNISVKTINVSKNFTCFKKRSCCILHCFIKMFRSQ